MPTALALVVGQVVLVALLCMKGEGAASRILSLGWRVALLTIMAYVPAALSNLLHISNFDYKDAAGPVNSVARVLKDFSTLAPMGSDLVLSVSIFGIVGLLGLAGIRKKAALMGLALAILSFVASEASRIVLVTPLRTLSSMVIPFVIGCALCIHSSCRRWPKLWQEFLGVLLFLGVAWVSFPAFAFDDPNGVKRLHVSNAVAVAETLAASHDKPVLILHNQNKRLRPYLVARFGADAVIGSSFELDSKLGHLPADDLPKGSWQARLRDKIFPKPILATLDPGAIKTVLVIKDRVFPRRFFGSKQYGDLMRGRKKKDEFELPEFQIRVFGPKR